MIHMTVTELAFSGMRRAHCRCGWTSAFVETLPEARRLGDEHLADANGATA